MRLFLAFIAVAMLTKYAWGSACLSEDSRSVTLTGTVYAVQDRHTRPPMSHWVLKLDAPGCLARGEGRAPMPVKEVQLVFASGSPYYEIYHGLVDQRSSFRVTGGVSHVRLEHPVRSVRFDVEDFVPRAAAEPRSAAPRKKKKRR